MNNKGFTLVEVLATVSIMVLIMLIAVPTSIKFIERGKNQQYKILEDQIISAASKYYIKNKSDKCITIDELNDSNLLNEIDEKYLDESGNVINPYDKLPLDKIVKVDNDSNDSAQVTYQLVDVDSCS